MTVFDRIKRVDLPVTRNSVYRKTRMLGEVQYLAKAGERALSAELKENYVLINRPIYAVIVDQYAVDLNELTPKQRESVRKSLQNAEIAEDRILSGALSIAVIAESEEDDGEQNSRLF